MNEQVWLAPWHFYIFVLNRGGGGSKNSACRLVVLFSISMKEATRHGSGKGQSGMNRTKETDTTKETEWSDSTKKKNQELRQDKENLEMNQIILQQKKGNALKQMGHSTKIGKKGGETRSSWLNCALRGDEAVY